MKETAHHVLSSKCEKTQTRKEMEHRYTRCLIHSDLSTVNEPNIPLGHVEGKNEYDHEAVSREIPLVLDSKPHCCHTDRHRC